MKPTPLWHVEVAPAPRAPIQDSFTVAAKNIEEAIEKGRALAADRWKGLDLDIAAVRCTGELDK